MKKSKTRNIIIISIIVFFILMVIIIGAVMSKLQTSSVRVQTDTVKKGDITASVSGPAKIQPEVDVKISANVSGLIIRMGVKEGDVVKRGDFLVELDQVIYKEAVNQAQSNLNYSKAGYDKSKNEYIRAETLFKDNLISKAELDIAKSTYEQAKAQVEQSMAALNRAKDDLAKTTIYSPMDGIVSQLNKKTGEMAMGSQFTLDVIMVIADLEKMQAETTIDEIDIIKISIGDTAHIQVDAYPDTVFLGRVNEIANTGTTRGAGTQEEVTNFLVKISMLTRPQNLRPGMSATVEIFYETRFQTLKVPIQCVTVRKPLKETDADSEEEPEKEDTPVFDEKADNITVVFVVEDGIAIQRQVVTGISSDTEWEILSGVEAEDEIVSGSYRLLARDLKHGEAVRVDNREPGSRNIN